MEKDPKLRNGKFTKIKNLYKIRSNFVHGSQVNIEKSALCMEEFIRKALVKFLFMYSKPPKLKLLMDWNSINNARYTYNVKNLIQQQFKG